MKSLTPTTAPPRQFAPTTIQLTPGGRDGLEARRREILEHRLPTLRPLAAGPDRDPAAAEEIDLLTREANELERILAEAEVLADDTTGFDGRVALGMRVLIGLPDGSQTWVRPVHPAEAHLDSERISATSPLAWSLLGARRDHLVWVASPTGVWACRVIEIDPRVSDGTSEREN